MNFKRHDSIRLTLWAAQPGACRNYKHDVRANIKVAVILAFASDERL